jgi:hypothetical protein
MRAVWLVLLVAAYLAGCDLLQTRDPEQPGGPGSTFVPPTSPEIVITNLQGAVREKNKENYRRCLVDTSFSTRIFQFEPTTEAAARYTGVFNDWSVVSEEQYFRNLSESKTNGRSDLFFFSTMTTSQSADEVLFSAKYHLVFQHQNSNIPEEARGNLQLYIARDQRSTWSIYRWIDTRDTSETTWSDFKANFR